MMARHSARSKACAICRRAKKKCDEVYPQCGTCVATNKKCPGPVQGNIFVNIDASSVAKQTRSMSEKRCGSYNRIAKKGAANFTSAIHSQNVTVTPLSDNRLRKQIHSIIGEDFHSVLLYDIQVISNLVYYYSESGQPQNGHGKRPQSWLIRLPDMAQNTLTHRMRAPLLAPSLLLLALRSNQKSVLKEALRWYGLGLGYLRERLSNINSNSMDDEQDQFLICGALLMSFYETLDNTLADGYEKHVLGALALVETKGPELFARTNYHNIFRTIRWHAVHVSLMNGRPLFLADRKWLSIPFSQSFKSDSERINDILLIIPRVIFKSRERLSQAADLTEKTIIKEDLVKDMNHFMKTLDGMHQIRKCYVTCAGLDTEIDFDHRYHGKNRLGVFRTAIEAKNTAIHAFAHMIILSILSPEALPFAQSYQQHLDNQASHSDSEKATREIQQASATILSAALFLSQLEIGCAYLRMILPLQLVAQSSQIPSHRATARAILQFWWREKPIKGLAGLALKSIDSGSPTLLSLLIV